jgi:hypothetical protein
VQPWSAKQHHAETAPRRIGAPLFANLARHLEALARGENDGSYILPWVGGLAARDQDRLRQDLTLVLLEEPETTGEPIDWREIEEILGDYAELAGWEGELTAELEVRTAGDFTVELRSRDRTRLAAAPAAVQRAASLLLGSYLSRSPTDGASLPRGKLEKMRNRDVWQIELPDGYRLRYILDKLAGKVRVVYLGPHPADGHHGRERGMSGSPGPVKRHARSREAGVATQAP